jgi:V/A-type H+-transporting ATPase subunit E
MALDNILEALEAEANQQIADLEQVAQTELAAIRTQAQANAEAVRQQQLAAIKLPIRAERTRLLNQAKLEALQEVLGTRETLISLVLEETGRRLAVLPHLASYPALLQQLIQEAVEALNGVGRLHVHVAKRDLALMNRIVEQLALSAVVEENLDREPAEWGGVVVTSTDGRISLINTLATRLERVARLYRARIAELIFDDEQEN